MTGFPAHDDDLDIPADVHGKLPDRAIPVASFYLLTYLDQDGRSSYLYSIRGEGDVAGLIGCLAGAQHSLLHGLFDSERDLP